MSGESVQTSGIDCREIAAAIGRLPLNQPAEAESRLGRLLDQALSGTPAPGDLFDLLEYAGSSLQFIRAAAVRHYNEHAPHLEEEAEAHFQRGLAMWRRMQRGYERCPVESTEGLDDAAAATHAATLLHRRLYYIAMQVVDHYRAKRQLPRGLWRQAHSCYLLAEALNVARAPVGLEFLEQQRTTHCQALLIALLLTEFAQPFSRPLGDLELIWDWAEKTAHAVRMGRAKVPANRTAFLVDLESDLPLRPLPGGDVPGSVRALETGALVDYLKERLAYLAKNRDDSGNNLRQRQLLGELIYSWSLSAMPRRFRRSPATGTVSLSAGFHDMHYFVLGRPFVQPGHVVEAFRPDHACEEWQVVDQNPCGFRLTRRSGAARVENQQLVALRPHDGRDFLLAQIQWLMREQSGRITAGVAVLPGVPVAVAVRAGEHIKGQKDLLARAFLLPAVPAMQADATVVLPPGFFREGDTLQLVDKRVQEVRMLEIVQRGADFERIRYAAV